MSLINLPLKKRLSFVKKEIGHLNDEDLIEFEIVNEGTISDPRQINCTIRIPVAILKSKWDWNNDKDWKVNGKHSWSKFPQWAEKYIIRGEIHKRKTKGQRTSQLNKTIKRNESSIEDLVFEGKLSEYLIFIRKYQINPNNLIFWQKTINSTLLASDLFLVRTGLNAELSICGNIYNANNHKIIITTDNEATVSAYEHFRNTTPNGLERFDLFDLLRTNIIKTGTIKSKDELSFAEVELIKSKRVKLGLSATGSGFPTIQKPFPMLKYSHLADAKDNYPKGLNSTELLVAATFRTISPFNIVMTHTPPNGNYREKHLHYINGYFPQKNDFGEDESLRKYFVALLSFHVSQNADGINTFKDFLKLANATHLISFVDNYQEVMKEAEAIDITVKKNN